MGADEGRDRRKQKEGGDCSVLCSSAFVLLDNNPPPPDSKNQVNPYSLEKKSNSHTFTMVSMTGNTHLHAVVFFSPKIMT